MEFYIFKIFKIQISPFLLFNCVQKIFSIRHPNSIFERLCLFEIVSVGSFYSHILTARSVSWLEVGLIAPGLWLVLTGPELGEWGLPLPYRTFWIKKKLKLFLSSLYHVFKFNYVLKHHHQKREKSLPKKQLFLEKQLRRRALSSHWAKGFCNFST